MKSTAKQARGKATRERVLDAALEAFTAKGIVGATIQDIAAASGTSVGSLYHHFGSRERIAFDLYCRSMASLLGAVAAPLPRRRTARSGVKGIVRSYLEWVAASPKEARFLYAAGQTELLDTWASELRVFKEGLAAPIVAWFGAHVEARAVRPVPPALLEVLVIGPPAEFARRWLAGVPGLELAMALAVLPKTVWRSVAQPTRAPR
jgi:AcrR family transcriptional regulator